MKIIEVPVSKIKPDPKQPRKTFDETAIKEMARSILTEGVINPIEVDKNLVIITGEQRWRSAKEAGLKTVPCKVLSIKPLERYRRQVIENIHHNTMTDWDTAIAIKNLLEQTPHAGLARDKFHTGSQFNKGYIDLAKIIGKSEDFISDHVLLLEAGPEFQEAVRKGKLSYAHTPAIRGIPEEFRSKFEKKLVAENYPSREITRVLARAIRNNPDKADEILKPSYAGLSVPEVISKIQKVVPSFSTTPLSDEIEKRAIPSEEISKTIDYLSKLLENNHPSTLGSLHLPVIALALDVLQNTINDWLVPTKHKQLKS